MAQSIIGAPEFKMREPEYEMQTWDQISYRRTERAGRGHGPNQGIEQLEVFAKHGAIPEENVLGQKFPGISSALYRYEERRAGMTSWTRPSATAGQANSWNAI